MRARNVGDAPGKAPQAVGSLADLLAQVVHELNSERAAAEEQEPRTPIGMTAVKAQAQPQASRIEGDGAFGMGCPDHQMIETHDGRLLCAPERLGDRPSVVVPASAKAHGHPVGRQLICQQARRPGAGWADGQPAAGEEPCPVLEILNREGKGSQPGRLPISGNELKAYVRELQRTTRGPVLCAPAEEDFVVSSRVGETRGRDGDAHQVEGMDHVGAAGLGLA